jgi:4-amino-4-deoxy-L-arabinose transferase-like glycosyltransferase
MNDGLSSRTGGESTSTRSAIVVCVALFLIALILRMAWLRFEGIPSQEGLDAVEYIALARHLAGGLGFTSDGISPSTYRPPLFSWLLGAWCYVLGSTSLKVMVWFEVVVQSLCAPMTYILAQRLQGSRLFAVIGGLFIATDPFLLLGVGFVLQEPTQMMVTTAMGISVAWWCREPSSGRAALAGFFFGLCALAKSPFLIAPFIVVGIYCFGTEFRRQLRVSHVIVVGILMVATVAPWTLRNYRVSGGRIIPINSQDMTFPIWLMADHNFVPRLSLLEPPRDTPKPVSGILLMYGNEEGIDLLRRKNEELLHEGLTGSAVTPALAEEARSYLLRHPAYVFRKVLRGVLLLCSPYATVGWSRSLAVRIGAMLLVHLPLAAAFVVGLVRSLREKNASAAILSLFAVAYLLAHAPAAVSGGRYSVPLLPLIIAVAGYGVWGGRRHAVIPAAEVPS